MSYEEDTSLYPLDGNPLRFGTDEIHGHLPVESAQGLLAHRLQGSFHGAFYLGRTHRREIISVSP